MDDLVASHGAAGVRFPATPDESSPFRHADLWKKAVSLSESKDGRILVSGESRLSMDRVLSCEIAFPAIYFAQEICSWIWRKMAQSQKTQSYGGPLILSYMDKGGKDRGSAVADGSACENANLPKRPA